MDEESGTEDYETHGEDNHTNEATQSVTYARSHPPGWQTVKKNAQKKFMATVERIMSQTKKDNDIQTLLQDPTELPIVKLLVIGKVTANSARILFEIEKSAKVTMVLIEVDDRGSLETGETYSAESEKRFTSSQMNGAGQVLKSEITMEAGRPGVCVFENLKPSTRYRVKLKGCEYRKSSGFRTFPPEYAGANSLDFAVISCNKIFITEKEIPVHSDLWAHLAKAIEHQKIDMCLHVGDQIYGDGDKMLDAEAGEAPGDWSDCFRKSKALLLDTDADQWEGHYETICEFYRHVYRMTWSHKPTAYCLANCPNLMIYDDHEVRDNWADLPGDWDSTGVDFFIARCAWRVNLEYQRQLHEDVNFSALELIDTDCHFHLISGIGIMFLDVRGSRTFHRVADDPYKYLGSRQWELVEKALKGGIFENARVLLVCTPAPLVFLESNFTDAFANNIARLEDFKGHWSAAPHVEEQKKMIECLCDWKYASTDRDVLVLGGDVHCGGHSEIFRDRKLVFKQLTTSAIANHPLPKSAYYMLRVAETLSGVGQNVTFKHRDWTRDRNYGLLHIRHYGPQAPRRPEITSQLIKGKFMTGIRDGKKVSNYRNPEDDYRDICPGCLAIIC